MSGQSKTDDAGRKRFVADAYHIPKGYQQITDLSSAVGLTVPDGASYAVIQAEDENVRYRDDGTSPTDAVGMLLEATDSIRYVSDLSAVEFIEVTSGAKLNVSYYGI